MHKPFLFLLVLCLWGNVSAQVQPEILIRTVLIDSNAPFKNCHASTIVALDKHREMAAWFGGTAEGKPDVAIWGCYIVNGKPGKVIELARGKDKSGAASPCWNPVLFKRGKRLYLFYKVGPNPREWWGEYKTSDDEGLHWSFAIRIPDGFLGPVRNQPVVLSDGRWLFPSSTEADNGEWKVQMETADPLLRNWRKERVLSDSFGVIQPALLRNGKGWRILCRSKQNVITESVADEKGQHWSVMKATSMPNPNSGIAAVTLRSGKHLLVYNPLVSGKNWWEGRSVLRLAISGNGTDWQDILTLEEHASGEYSYPYIIQDEKGLVHITYTDQRRTIHYLQLKLH
jgi:predicted neuraminidase